jgi:predicted phosphodiesterase
MYKIAIFSDVHANLPALEAVLEDIDTWQPDTVVCLGDLVDFAPWPNETIAMIRKARILTVLGNHDERIATERPTLPLPKHSMEERRARACAIEWTRNAITPQNKEYLKSLPTSLTLKFPVGPRSRSILMTHAGPYSIDEYIYEDHPENILEEALSTSEVDVLVSGHTHLSYIREISNSTRIVMNVGSVGRTKEKISGAVYGRLTINDHGIKPEIIRIQYPITTTISAIRQSQIPSFYTEFLQKTPEDLPHSFV